jgi:hypothetical protein
MFFALAIGRSSDLRYMPSDMPNKLTDGDRNRFVNIGPYLDDIYGPALDYISEVFFGLDHQRLQRLFDLYDESYGRGAANYAVRSYHSWSAGTKSMSGQTWHRLLQLMPQIMTHDEKTRLMRLLREHTLCCLRKRNMMLTVSQERGFEALIECVSGLLKEAGEVELPNWFYSMQTWLAGREAQELQALTKEIEQEINHIRIKHLLFHVVFLIQLQTRLPAGANTTVNFEMPTAHVTLRVSRPRRYAMSNDDDALVRLHNAIVQSQHQAGSVNYIDYVLRTLTPEEEQRLRQQAATAGLEIAEFVKRVQEQMVAAEAQVETTLKAADAIRAGGHSGKITTVVDTGSGRTTVEITPGRNSFPTIGWGVAVVVVASLLALLLYLGGFLTAPR